MRRLLPLTRSSRITEKSACLMLEHMLVKLLVNAVA